MTDTELRGAAERVVRSKVDGFAPWGGKSTAYDAEAEACAARLLELLPPADDGEFTTPEWLLSVGFATDPEIEFVRGHRGAQAEAMYAPCEHDVPRYGVANMAGDEWWFYLLGGDGYDGSEDSVTPVLTRGRVRQVCRALNITLTEPTP